MLGSLHGRQVIIGEQGVLHELALQAIGLTRSARGSSAPRGGAGLWPVRVVDKLLFLVPPVLTEQRLADPFS
jgi:hypothetical protein